MKDLKYRFNNDHHLNENIYHDAIRLFDRIVAICDNYNVVPGDVNHMKYYNWSRDHINRCYKMLRELKLVDYVPYHRRTTLKFLGDYAYLNKYIKKEDI